MKTIFFAAAFLCSVLSHTALSQTNEKAPKDTELHIKIAKLIIDGKGKVGKDISLQTATAIAYGLATQNQPQLAWGLAFNALKENPQIQGDEKWLLLNTLVSSAKILNKKQITKDIHKI